MSSSRANLPVWRRGWDELTGRQQRIVACVVIASFAAMMAYCLVVYARGLGWSDTRDYIHFYEAARAARLGEDIYLSGTRGYIYPPLFALIMLPFGVLSYPSAAAAWTCVNVALLVGGVWLIAREVCERFALAPPTARLLHWTVAGAGVLAVGDKARAVLQNGQSDALTVLLIGMAFRVERTRPFLCGVLLGLACNIKYHTLVFLIYFVARRRWREAGGMLMGLTVGALAGVPLWGWSCNTDYLLRALDGMGDMASIRTEFGPNVAVHALTWIHSVSITSGLARMIDHLEHTAVFLAAGTTAALAAFFAGWWMLRCNGFNLFVRRAGAGERSVSTAPLVALEWAGLLAATVIFSPQSIGRHFYLMVFPAMVAAPAVFFPRHKAPRWPIVGAWLLFLLGMNLPPAASPWHEELRTWRFVGGLGWCALVYYFAVLWTSLRWLRSGESLAGARG